MVSGVDEDSVSADRTDELCLLLAGLKAAAVASALGSAGSAGVAGSAGGASASGSAGSAGVASASGSAGLGGVPAGRRALVLGCDSMLDFEGRALGKPAGVADAVERWRAMRGRTGTLHTGHCLIDAGSAKRAEGVASTIIHFADVSDAEIDAYVATGEPLRVAGGFTIDGLGGPFVDRIEGDHGTVVGLSLPLLRRLLVELGTSITGLWRDGLASDA
jgi:septum formation protein